MPRTVTATVDVEELEKLVWSMRDIAAQLSQSQNPRIKAGARQLQAVPGRVVVACGLREQVGLDGKLHLVAPEQPVVEKEVDTASEQEAA
jgi:hypothetical protein